MLQTVITSSVLIIIIALLRQVLKGKIPARLQYALWGLVLLRLALPFDLLPAPVSVANAVNTDAVVSVAQTAKVPLYTYDPSEYTSDDYIRDYEVTPAQVKDVTPAQVQLAALQKAAERSIELSAEQIVAIVWAAGALAVGTWLAVVNVKFYTKLKAARKPCDIRRGDVKIYTLEALPSPCLFGIIKPAIYLNSAAMPEDRTECVITHELCHRAHGDHIFSLLRGIAVAVYWFNPLVWLAAELSKRDCELACDEAVVKRLGEDNRLGYAKALVDMIAQKRKSSSSVLCTATTMVSDKKGIKERVSMIAGRKKTLMWAIGAAAVAVAVAAVLTFTGRQAAPLPTFPQTRQEAYTAFKDETENSIVYVIDGKLYAQNRKTGRVSLLFEADNRQTVSTVHCSEDRVYFLCKPKGNAISSTLYSVKFNGRQLKTVISDEAISQDGKARAMIDFILADGYAVIKPDRQGLWSVNLSNSAVSHLDTGYDAYCMACVGDRVYCTRYYSSSLDVFDLTTGEGSVYRTAADFVDDDDAIFLALTAVEQEIYFAVTKYTGNGVMLYSDIYAGSKPGSEPLNEKTLSNNVEATVIAYEQKLYYLADGITGYGVRYPALRCYDPAADTDTYIENFDRTVYTPMKLFDGCAHVSAYGNYGGSLVTQCVGLPTSKSYHEQSPATRYVQNAEANSLIADFQYADMLIEDGETVSNPVSSISTERLLAYFDLACITMGGCKSGFNYDTQQDEIYISELTAFLDSRLSGYNFDPYSLDTATYNADEGILYGWFSRLTRGGNRYRKFFDAKLEVTGENSIRVTLYDRSLYDVACASSNPAFSAAFVPQVVVVDAVVDDSGRKLIQSVEMREVEKTSPPVVTFAYGSVLTRLADLDWRHYAVGEVLGNRDAYFNRYDIYTDEGICVRYSEIDAYSTQSPGYYAFPLGNVENILLNAKYGGEIIDGIKVTDSREKIEHVLGKPQFETESGEGFGYATRDFYVFFNGNGDGREVSIYPVFTEPDDILAIANAYAQYPEGVSDYSPQVLFANMLNTLARRLGNRNYYYDVSADDKTSPRAGTKGFASYTAGIEAVSDVYGNGTLTIYSNSRAYAEGMGKYTYRMNYHLIKYDERDLVFVKEQERLAAAQIRLGASYGARSPGGGKFSVIANDDNASVLTHGFDLVCTDGSLPNRTMTVYNFSGAGWLNERYFVFGHAKGSLSVFDALTSQVKLLSYHMFFNDITSATVNAISGSGEEVVINYSFDESGELIMSCDSEDWLQAEWKDMYANMPK